MSDEKKIDSFIKNARQGKLDEVKKLLEEGVNINSKEPRGIENRFTCYRIGKKIDEVSY